MPPAEISLRVLVVDDHHDAAETLGGVLELLGCEVQVAHSGEEALRVAPNLRPQLVILDIQMRGMDGLETAKRLRLQTWSRRSVFATHSAHSDPAIEDLSREAGCDHHIPKPASIGTFEKVIAAIRATETDN